MNRRDFLALPWDALAAGLLGVAYLGIVGWACQWTAALIIKAING